MTIEDLPEDWDEIGVDVEVVSAGIDFESATGTIRVRRNDDSVPCLPVCLPRPAPRRARNPEPGPGMRLLGEPRPGRPVQSPRLGAHAVNDPG